MRQGTTTILATLLVSVLTPLGASAQPIELHVESRAYLLEVTAASHAQAEIAELAVQKAEDEEVREFAEVLLDGYGERFAALSELAEEHGVAPVTALDPVSARQMEMLRTLSGPAFDAEYLTGQVPALYAEGWVHRRAAEHVPEERIREAAEAAIAPTEASFDRALELALGREDDLPDGLHPWDSTALVFGMNIDQAQVAMGELVLSKTEDEQVRSFAERMVEEHGRSLAAKVELAEEHGEALIETLGPVETRVLERLSQMSGEALDLEYMGSQVIFHDHWYKRLEFTANNGRDETVRAMAISANEGGLAHHGAARGMTADGMVADGGD